MNDINCSKDYYQVLGVARTATAAEIKKAFRQLAMKYHPDRNSDKQAEAKFKEVNEANDVLSNPQKRRRYDAGSPPVDFYNRASQENSRRRSPSSPFSNFDGVSFTDEGIEFDDEFINSIFGNLNRSSRKSRTARPAARTLHLEIPLATAVLGDTIFTTAFDGRTLKVEIPPGTENGDAVFATSPQNPAEPIKVVFEIKPDSTFTRQGHDLYGQVEIDSLLAILGGDITIKTFRGNLKVVIPAGIQPDQLIRLQGQGVVIPQKRIAGHLFVKIKVRLPRNLTSQEKQLYEQLAALHK